MTTNTPTTKTPTAADFFAWEASLGPYTEWTAEVRNEREARFKTLSTADKYLVKRGKVDEFFTPENARLDCQHTASSPSGKYRLVTTPYGTKPGSWNYTLGEVYRVPESPETERVKVAEVRRNYSSLWCAWVENHPVTGHDYLLTGEDYQGFTVVNLSTGKVSTHIPDEAFAGHGWCPVSAEVLPAQEAGVTLKVSGCYWACPYEVRLYDFSAPDAPGFPESGLPNLTADLWFDEDENTTLTVDEDDGSVALTQHRKRFRATGEWEHEVEAKRTLLHERAHKAKKRGDSEEVARVKQEEEELGALYYPEDDDEDEAAWEKVPYTREVYARSPEGGKYVEVPERKWKSEYALACEQRAEEYKKKSAAEFRHYADTEPLYQLAKSAWPEDYASRTGKQGQSLVSRWDGDDNPFYFHVRVGPEHDGSHRNYTAALVWGATDGPVKAECWTHGKGTAVYLFPRNEDGWRDALARARAHLEQEDAEAVAAKKQEKLRASRDSKGSCRYP